MPSAPLLRAVGLIFFGLIVATILSGCSADAHESRPAYLQITQTAPSQFTLLWRTPMRGSVPLPVIVKLPADVRDIRNPLVQTLSDSRLERRWIEIGPEGLAGARIGFPGLELTITDAITQVKMLDGRSWMAIARPSQPWVEMEPDRGRAEIFADFLRQGVHHILYGFDHLLFVFGLLLLVPARWMLVKTITAFTVAHSITLAAATLGYISLPAPPIEAAIALSILFLGVEVVRAQRGGTSIAIRHPWVIAFAFGLLHGFGFAGALSAAGLPPADLPLALVSFNLGVEAGQLAFVALVLLVVGSMRRLGIAWPQQAELAPAYLVGALGAFWFLRRLAFL
ncbi:HupE/UreJ family protein [Rhizobiales bacterium]|uniref:HupE/UreJ family protein n=1 Tax=Hongsoonwoonella zoysiae TaxID=2821844 RepID=UPI0015617091|nr:HupE/UreJ family protein [Hongsoonwoonella zoysiae]NRG16085.1 HupE/UreJ family protein [Hongsoonwoonella zoysiae]